MFPFGRDLASVWRMPWRTILEAGALECRLRGKHLPSKHKVLGSTPSPKEREKGGREGKKLAERLLIMATFPVS